jgi:hypothetical protein
VAIPVLAVAIHMFAALWPTELCPPVAGFKRECLGLVVDTSLTAQRVVRELSQIIEEWRIDYNTNLQHTSLNGLTPTEFATRPNRSQIQNRLYS